MPQVTIEHEGPIDRAVFQFPDHGALLYLRGENGAGKSHALTALDELMNKPTASELEVSRGETRGFVEGFGVRLTLGESTRRKGELAIFRMEGLDPSSVIDPGIDDEERADTARIKALARLVMAGSDVPGFAALVGGIEVLNEYAAKESLAAVGVVDQAALLKRDFERHAQALAKQVEAKRTQASGLLQNASVDMATAKESTKKREELEREAELAIQALGQLEGRRQEAERARNADSGARRALDELRASDPIDETAAQAALDEAQSASEDAFELVGRAGAEVKAAKEALDLAMRRETEASQSLAKAKERVLVEKRRVDAARKRKDDIAKAEQAVKDAGVSIAEPPTEAEIQAAQERRDAARKARDRGVTIRDARVRVGQAEAAAAELSAAADALDKKVANLRDWSASVWDVVAARLKPILPAGLTIKGGRLIVTKGTEEFFFGGTTLSDGERTDIVIRATAEAANRQSNELAKQTGEPRRRPMLVFPQRWGQDLQPKRRLALTALARELDVWIVTAQCDDGPLRLEVVGEERAA